MRLEGRLQLWQKCDVQLSPGLSGPPYTWRLLRHTKEGIVFTLTVHPDADEDLRAVVRTDRSTGVDLLTYLQELGSDQDQLDLLTVDGYDHQGGHWLDNISVRAIVSQQRAGNNLWRLKLWDLEREGIQYRLIYAFTPLSKTIHILAVVHRDSFNYEPDHPITRRVLSAYASL